MPEKSVAEKARVKPGTTVAFLNPEHRIIESLGLPGSVRFVEPPDAQILCIFIRTRAELEAELRRAEDALPNAASLWVFFRKGSKAAGHDVNRDDVWGVADTLDLRPLGLVSVDASWSVFRFRRCRDSDESERVPRSA